MSWLLSLALMSATCPPPAPAEGDHSVPGAVTVAAVRHANRICMVVANGTQTPVYYHHKNNRGGKSNLERRVLWGWVGVRYATLGQWWHDIWKMRTLGVPWLRSLPAQRIRSYLLPHKMETFAPGRYRVCLRYWVRTERDWQEACSTPFRLP